MTIFEIQEAEPPKLKYAVGSSHSSQFEPGTLYGEYLGSKRLGNHQPGDYRKTAVTDNRQHNGICFC